MAGKREYGEACPVAHSLDIVGDRWALLVVRELRLGPKRFSDLQASLPRAGPNVLAARLRELTETGVLVRRRLPPPAGSPVYQLTEWGAELEPVFEALARWGMRSPVVKREGRLSADSVMLAVRSFFRPAIGPGRRRTSSGSTPTCTGCGWWTASWPSSPAARRPASRTPESRATGWPCTN